MTLPSPANVYTQGFGSKPQSVEVPIVEERYPLAADTAYPLGKMWVFPLANYIATLSSFSYQGSVLQALWQGNWVIVAAGTSGPLSSGSVVVSAPATTPSSIVLISPTTFVGTISYSYVNPSSVTYYQFTITSLNASDQSIFYYIVLNQG